MQWTANSTTLKSLPTGKTSFAGLKNLLVDDECCQFREPKILLYGPVITFTMGVNVILNNYAVLRDIKSMLLSQFYKEHFVLAFRIYVEFNLSFGR